MVSDEEFEEINIFPIDNSGTVRNKTMNMNIITPWNQYKSGGLLKLGTKIKNKNKL